MVYCYALLRKAGLPIVISYDENLPTGEKAHQEKIRHSLMGACPCIDPLTALRDSSSVSDALEGEGWH